MTKPLPFRFFVTLLLFSCFIPELSAQRDSSLIKNGKTGKDSVDYYDMSLEQLLNIKGHDLPTELESLINSLISVASKKPLSARESPSIVTLVTAEEIKNSGARDLIDVMRLVPGFDFGMDVEGVVGIGTRGSWGHEGKVLLLIDGQEMNELLYAGTQFGNHYPIDQIKRIEIIRGPGSAIYGGYAEYGVINIITRSGADINGISATGTYGKMQDGMARQNISLAAGKKINDFEFSIAGLIGQGNRSDQVYSDFYGNSFQMADKSALNPNNLNVGLSWKGLSFRGIYDSYQTMVGDGYDKIPTIPYHQDFNSTFAELKYVWKIGDKITLTPRLNYKRQQPYLTPQTDSVAAYSILAERYSANLTMSYNITRNINIVAGGEMFRDQSTELDTGHFVGGLSTVKYLNYAGFLQGLYKHRIVNVIFGARYDNNSAFGDALVPRVGLTKKIHRFNFKLLYSQSFRAPAIENINGAYIPNSIRPERTEVIELEGGYELTRKSILTVNLYHISTLDPIVYYVAGVNTDAYANFGHSGTKGIEAEYKTKHHWGYLTMNYAFYTTQGMNEVSNYQVPGKSDILLAFPAHKANLTASIRLSKHLSFNPSVLFRSESYGYTRNPDSLQTGTPILTRFKPQVFTNIYLNANDVFVKGLSIGLGVFDLFNEKTLYLQPYNGPHAPLPGTSREFLVRIRYDLAIRKKE
ncbi:MAG TPA: TonB-dependent receptor plug domain-containing protein [Bacteroidia bacterium]|jgi:outer membrane cobalamin receptor|nr:TonB-dependent receptor plug domain-containing protein [Bacteroidia bacterium]